MSFDKRGFWAEWLITLRYACTKDVFNGQGRAGEVYKRQKGTHTPKQIVSHRFCVARNLPRPLLCIWLRVESGVEGRVEGSFEGSIVHFA